MCVCVCVCVCVVCGCGVALRCVALRCVALRCVALRCVALRCVALRCVALRCVALRCVALRCVALRCVALRCVVCARSDIYGPGRLPLDHWIFLNLFQSASVTQLPEEYDVWFLTFLFTNVQHLSNLPVLACLCDGGIGAFIH